MSSISSTERKASIKEFYAVIYPSLRLLEGEFNSSQNNDQRSSCTEVLSRNSPEKVFDKDQERDEECGICMENSKKIVLPGCGHSMCCAWAASMTSTVNCRPSQSNSRPPSYDDKW